MDNDGINLFPGQHHRDIQRLLRPRHVAQVSEITFQGMPEEEQQGVERLVLR